MGTNGTKVRATRTDAGKASESDVHAAEANTVRETKYDEAVNAIRRSSRRCVARLA